MCPEDAVQSTAQHGRLALQRTTCRAGCLSVLCAEEDAGERAKSPHLIIAAIFIYEIDRGSKQGTHTGAGNSVALGGRTETGHSN